jgi:hypothetical protein
LDWLHRAVSELPTLLRGDAKWRGVFVDYHPPFVERLWREWLDYRIFLHRIHPCAAGEALLHPHPWPSAMRVLDGCYEMAVGYGAGTRDPRIAAKLILRAGSEYEMTDPDGCHYVRPLDKKSLSIMITGKPWAREAPTTFRKLTELSTQNRNEILELFRSVYG